MSILDRLVDFAYISTDYISGSRPKKHKAFKRPKSQLDEFRDIINTPERKKRPKHKAKKRTKKYSLQYLDDTISFYNDKGGRYV